MLPVLVPLAAGSLMLFSNTRVNLTRTLGFLSCTALVAIAIALFREAAHGTYVAYPLGNWPAPFGIVLVLDRLSATLLLITSILGLASFLYALRGWDERGAHFHALFQFQLMGINGAFLTGDLFNLFVFFEVLLIASYGLLLHGGGARRLRAGIHYVVLNLAGSALFLIALGLLYGVTGTLNLADLQMRFAQVPAADRGLAEAASMLLLIVFGLKAAAFPLYFWLPGSYAAASAPVAALFAIMTKVGVYAMLRVHVLTFGVSGPASALWPDVLLTAALITLTLATIGALAARSLRSLVANLTVASVGTLMITVGMASTGGITAGVYYLVHSTFVVACLFLLAELIAEQRSDRHDALLPGPELSQPTLLGVLFVVGAAGIAGLPPLSGFLGKVGVLLAARASSASNWIWVVVLGCSVLTIIALARAGSQLFWKTTPREPDAAPVTARFIRLFAVGLLIAPLIGLAVFARPVWDFAVATAEQITNPKGYRRAVLGGDFGGDAVRPFPPAPRKGR